MKSKSTVYSIDRAGSEFSAREMVLLAKVSATNGRKGCRTSNRQFEKLLKIGERQVRSSLARLREMKLLTIRFEGGQRSIHSTPKLARLLSK